MYSYYRYCSVLIVLLYCICLSACGGGNGPANLPELNSQQQPVVQDGSDGILHEVVMQPQQPLDEELKGISSLGAPTQVLSQLPAAEDTKSTLCAGSGWYIEGGAFQDGLPLVNVVRTGTDDSEGLYSPAYDGLDLASASYAMYRWNLRGYTGEQTVGFGWVDGQAPVDWHDFYVGFADLADDRWVFFRGPDDDVLTIDSFGPYRSAAGEVLVVLVLLGSEPADLAYMQAGVPEMRATGDNGLPDDAPDFPLLGNSGALPASVDLSVECAPINDQLQWGSCTAFAVGDGAYNFELGQTYGSFGWNLKNPRNRVSPKYLYMKSGEVGGFPPGGGYGRWTDEVIDVLQVYGVATEANAPYNNIYEEDWGLPAEHDAEILRIEGWQEVPCNSLEGIDTVKQVLAQQHKVLPMRAYLDSGFMSLLPGQIWYYTFGTVGGHAMCIVGYDDSKGISGAFKVRNSWGPFWGDHGHVWIGYETFLNPNASIRCWTISEDYGADVVDYFGLGVPGIAPVTGLEASDGTSQTGIELSWDEHAAASEIRIYRDDRSNLVATLAATESSWIDTDVQDSFGHVYWAQADGSQLSSPDTGYRADSPSVISVLPQEATEGEILAVSAAGTGSAPLSYQWNFGGGASPNTSTEARPIVTFGSPGTYSASLTISNPIGSDTYNFQLKVNSIPVVVHYIDGASGFSGDPTTISAVTEGTPDSYLWDFGGGASPDSSSLAQPSVTLGSPGLYEASLTVVNGSNEDVFNFYLSVVDPADTAWTTPWRDGRNSRQSPVNGPLDGNLAWKFHAGIPGNNVLTRISSPLVLANGNIIFSANNDSSGSALRCVASDGSPIWQVITKEFSYRGQPFIGVSSGQLYCNFNESIQAFDAVDGSLLWESAIADSYDLRLIGESSAATLYAVLNGKFLVGLDSSDGSEQIERVLIADKYNYQPQALITADDRLFIGGYFNGDNLLIKVDALEGIPVDNDRVPEKITGMAVSPDGLNLYTCDKTTNTRCYDLASCNELWWQKDTRGQGGNAPAVLADGTVIVLSGSGLLSALNPGDGSVLWQYGPHDSGELAGMCAIGRDGTVFYGGDQQVHAVKDGSLVWQSALNPDAGFDYPLSIGGDGNLHIGDSRGRLWTFGPGSGTEIAPPVIASISPDTGTSGELTVFSASVQGTAPLTYAWDFGGGAVPDSSSDEAPSVTLAAPGYYHGTLSVTNALGSDSLDFDFSVFNIGGNTPPVADLQADVSSGDPPLTVTLDASGSTDLEGPIANYSFRATTGEINYVDNGTNPVIQFTYGASGTYTAELEVTDLEGAISAATVEITINGGEPHYFVVNNGNDGGKYPQLLEVDGYPAFVYRHEGDGQLSFQRAQDANGSAWDPALVIDASCSGEMRDAFALVGGFPAVAYVDAASRDLRFIRATNAQGSAWGSPVTVKAALTTGDAALVQPGMVMANGNPAISFYDPVAMQQYYIRADSADGSSWGNAAQLLHTGSTELRGQSMALIAGRPALIFELKDTSIHYLRAADASGSGWGILRTVPAPGRLYLGQLIDAGGLPVFTSYTTGSMEGDGVYMLRGGDADGSAWADAVLVNGQPRVGRWSRFGAILHTGSGYFCTYIDNNQTRFYQRTSFNDDGASWTEQTMLGFGSILGPCFGLAMVNGGPAATMFDNNGKLTYLSYY